MTLVADVLRVLPHLRAEAEALMVDACMVGRPGAPVTDADGVVTVPLVPMYAGRCKVQQTIAQASSPVAGERKFSVQSTRWDTPVLAGPFAVDDVVTVTACLLDPQLVGRVFRVVESFHKSMATAQRTRVEEITA